LFWPGGFFTGAPIPFAAAMPPGKKIWKRFVETQKAIAKPVFYRANKMEMGDSGKNPNRKFPT